jgi:ATP-dependent helicase HepA
MENNLTDLIQKLTPSLAKYLERVLPAISSDWWNRAVVNNLSFQQQNRLKQRNIQSLASLDLAALLRVFDQNWYHISTKLSLSPEIRHFVKEMQTVRNRWAHAASEGFCVDDVYRDLDTLQRFATAIDADVTLLQEVRTRKSALLPKDSNVTSPSQTGDGQVSKHRFPNNVQFEPGQIVCLKSNPGIRGAVMVVVPGQPENRYKVFMDGSAQTYYESQLKAEESQKKDFQVLSCEWFHCHLSALQIRYPGLSTLYSLNAARVDFIPYQFRPVLKFIRSDRPRMLIADGVGVGKTIEAGLILRELQARRDIRSILIICPRPLVIERKWEVEMKRFEERFTHLDGPTLRYCIDEMDREGAWPDQHQRVIVPYSLFDEMLLYGSGSGGRRRNRKGMLDLDPPPRFDLVIVDEAHHIRNQDTYSYRAVRFFCDHAEAVVFLTATPIQLGSHDLFVLLNTLRPDIIIDQESFAHMAEPNPYINQAVALARANEPEWIERTSEVLHQAANTAWGRAILAHNPDFNRVCGRIRQGGIGDEERVQLINAIEGFHTFAGIINRTRRRDIGDFTVRKPQAKTVEFTPAQKELHDEVLRVQAEIFSRLHGNLMVKFMMTTIRRQAASCLFGLAPLLEEILHRHLDELSWEEADNTEPAPQGDVVDSIQASIQGILEKVRTIDSEDPKLETLRTILQEKENMANNKVMVFSSFRHTLHYLHQHLKADGIRVGMVHGGTPDEDRAIIRNLFAADRESNDSLDLLLFSEIGCEGLDYQFCDCIVNYDLPWNPMRVEQRIGRIDRKGQKSEKILIYNLITPGTVDADIYERCLQRIGVFDHALGGSEEILGEITREIKHIAEDFSLNEEERRAKLQQLVDNKVRLIEEQEKLEERQMELFGIRLPEKQLRREIEEASSYWLTPNSISRLVNVYFQRACGKEQAFILGEKPLKTLRLSQEARSIILRDFQRLPRYTTPAYRDWENWLKGGNPHLPIAFEADCAAQHPEAAFIMPLHPLVKQAALTFDAGKPAFTAFQAKSEDLPPGVYDFAIYQWQFYGIREDLLLRPIASSDGVTEHLPWLLTKAQQAEVGKDGLAESFDWERLDSKHYKLWVEAREQHRQRNQELAEFRKESLTTSHNARISLLDEQLRQATNEKIKKMRESQIAAAQADYARRIQDLEIAMERAEVTAEPIAYGVVYIGGGSYAE